MHALTHSSGDADLDGPGTTRGESSEETADKMHLLIGDLLTLCVCVCVNNG